jgi:hypothetical protein
MFKDQYDKISANDEHYHTGSRSHMNSQVAPVRVEALGVSARWHKRGHGRGHERGR